VKSLKSKIIKKAEDEWKNNPHVICKKCGSEILEKNLDYHKELCRELVKTSKTKNKLKI